MQSLFNWYFPNLNTRFLNVLFMQTVHVRAITPEPMTTGCVIYYSLLSAGNVLFKYSCQ